MTQRSVTVRQIQLLDQIAIDQYSVPSLALMENAGRNVAEEVKRLLKAKKKVCVVCGLGNNAGDGFVVARHLINKGCRVDIILIGEAKKLKHDAAVNYAILKKLRVPVLKLKRLTRKVAQVLSKSDIVVDAVFGVGLNREVGEPFSSFIEAINTHAKRIVSVDTPSGLDATKGSVYGVCVRAHTTVTFTFAKTGFKKGAGPRHAGRIVVVDIGIPKSLHKRI